MVEEMIGTGHKNWVHASLGRKILCFLIASAFLFAIGNAFAQGSAQSICTKGSGPVAVTACQEALLATPNNPEIAGALARHHNAARNFDEALEVLNTAIARNPGHHGLLYDIAATICFKSSGSEAIIVCKAALRAAPADVAVARTLAVRYREEKQFSEALRVLNAALTLNPEDKSLLSDMATAKSDVAEEEWLKIQKSEDENSEATEKPVSRLDKIRCRKLQGRAGLQACDKALSAEPNDLVLRTHRAAYLESLGETTSAIAAYRAVLARDPENAVAQSRLSILDP